MKCSLAFFVAVFLGACTAPSSEKEITIKGKVQFPDNQFNMEIVERNGFDKTIIDSCKVNEDGTYRFTMKVDRPGVYTLDCQKWQSVQFWAEDEDLEIDFRGMDTARIKIKNPPYVYINGGPNNEVMNLMNWDSYRNYQLMIGVSQGVYRIQGLDDHPWKKYKLCREHYGMSTKRAQSEMSPMMTKGQLKTSEGITKIVKIEYSLEGWIENFEHYLRTMISYCNKYNLESFIGNVTTEIMSPNAFNSYYK